MTSLIRAWVVGAVLAGALILGSSSATPAAPVTGGCVAEVGGFNNPSCTANDVALTGIVEGSLVILDADGGCTSTADTVTFTARGIFELTTQARYDVGIYISTDGDPDNTGAKFGSCARDILATAPDPPYVDLDGDACGDIDEAHGKRPPAGNGPLVQLVTSPLGPVTIQCVDKDQDDKVDIFHCETWRQPGADNRTCNSAADVSAGTGSKCNCGTLAGACIAAPDGDPCTVEVCRGTCSNDTQRACEDSADCSDGGTCQGIRPTSIPAAAGTPCGSGSDTACDNPDTCDGNGNCQANLEPPTTVCRAAAGVCDLRENCTGTSADCPADAKVASGTGCRAAAGVCDVAEVCTGVDNDCPADAKRASGTECRAAAGVCDVEEVCDGSSDTCPADAFASTDVVCRGAAGECDTAETCDGAGSCPADAKRASGTECRAAAGVCDVEEVCDGSSDTCPADAFASTDVVCRAAAGECDVAENCPGDGAACPGNAVQSPGSECDAEGDPCTLDECDAQGACVFVELNPECLQSTEICRTAGFWSTHAGTDKGAVNQTGRALASCGGCMVVCGEKIDATVADDADSVLEALCVRRAGRSSRQLARQLTAAALNCGVSGGPCDCSAASIAEIFAACDDACIAGERRAIVDGVVINCVTAIDCFNNGGRFDPTAAVICKIGDCIDDVSGADVGDCGQGGACPVGSTCVPTPGNCHDRDLPLAVCDPAVEKCAAGSAKECRAARRSRCTIVPPNETDCEICTGRGRNQVCEPAGLQCEEAETCEQTTCDD